MHLFMNSLTFKCVLPFKVFFSTLNRSLLWSFLFSQIVREYGGVREKIKLIFPNMISWWQLLQRGIFDAWIHWYARISLKNAGRWMVCKMGRFVNNSMIWVYPAVNVMVSTSLRALSLVSNQKKTTLNIFHWNLQQLL